MAEGFADDYAVLPLSRQQLDLMDSERVFDCLKRNQADVVIHSATYDASTKYSRKDPAKVLESNMRMFFNIVRCRDYFGKMIYFGSGAEFGRENWTPRMGEDYFDRHVPTDQYGLSKYIMTKYAQSGSGIFNLRLFGVFGKYEDWRYRFISNACRKAAMNQPITINQNVLFDYLYIEDLTRIVKWFIDNEPRAKAYNACTGKSVDIKSIAEKIVAVSGKDISIAVKSEGYGREYSGDNSLLMGELGAFEFTPLDEAIGALYDWYNENQHIVVKDVQ